MPKTKKTDPPAVPTSRHGHEQRTLQDWRTRRGWTRFQLAVASGVSPTTLEILERARGKPSLETAEKVAAALDLYVEQLVWLEVTAAPPSKRDRHKRVTDDQQPKGATS